MSKRQGAVGKKRTSARKMVHISEQDRRDLERFRAALSKLNAQQKKRVIGLMLGKPGTP